MRYFQIEYPSLEAGEAALNATHVWGLIYFTSNYTSMLKKRIDMKLFASRQVLDFSTAQITLDATSKLIHILIYVV